MKSIVALGTRRIAKPNAKINKPAMRVRASPKRRPHAGACADSRTNANNGILVNSPAAVAPQREITTDLGNNKRHRNNRRSQIQAEK